MTQIEQETTTRKDNTPDFFGDASLCEDFCLGYRRSDRYAAAACCEVREPGRDLDGLAPLPPPPRWVEQHGSSLVNSPMQTKSMAERMFCELDAFLRGKRASTATALDDCLPGQGEERSWCLQYRRTVLCFEKYLSAPVEWS